MNLLQGQFPLQYEPRKAQVLVEPGLFRCPDGALGGGVERKGGMCASLCPNVLGDLEDGKVLHYHGVGPGLLYFFQLSAGLSCLGVKQDCVQCDENPCPETVCVAAQRTDVLYVIPRSLPGPELRSCNIYGIGTAVYCCGADAYIPGRGQELKLPGLVACHPC